MNKITFPFILLFLMGTSCSQTSVKNEVEEAPEKQQYLSITYSYGEGTNLIYIGTNQKSLDSLFSQETSHIMEIFDPEDFKYNVRGLNYFVLKPDAFNSLVDYMKLNNVKDFSNRGLPDFFIDFYSKEYGVLHSRAIVKSYFQGLIGWMDQSAYKGDYSRLASEFQNYLDL